MGNNARNYYLKVIMQKLIDILENEKSLITGGAGFIDHLPTY